MQMWAVTCSARCDQARSDPCGEYGVHTPARHMGWGLWALRGP
jgi:hypothetical protein